MESTIDPKPEIFAKLSEITGAKVSHDRPEILEDIPAIIYFLSGDAIEYTLDKGIGAENISLEVDVYADTPEETSELCIQIELKMRAINYLRANKFDVPDPEGYSHVRLQFTY